MVSNLARPYGTKASPPHDARLVFWSKTVDDLLFPRGEQVEIQCRAGLRSVSLSWTLARNMFDASFCQGTAEALPENRFLIRIPVETLRPGMFDLRVSLDPGNGEMVQGLCTFGYDVEQMPITLDRPADFREFWAKGQEKLQGLPLDARAGEVKCFRGQEIDAYNLSNADIPADYDPDGHITDLVESQKVSFSSRDGMRVHGWLAKPPGPGPFPAMLVLPGAGFAARPRPLEHARHGYLALDIQVHGQDVDLTEYPSLPGYSGDYQYDPPGAYYYHRVYLNALQALNYLFSRPDVDPSRVVVVGGSQGGRLTTVVSALDSRVAAAVPALAHYGNLPYLFWFQDSNRASPPKDGMDRDAPPPLPDSDEGRCLGYYDILSFAPDVTCPVLMNAGLIDPVSYSTGVFSVFKLLGSKEKQIIPLPGLGHDWSAEFDRRAWRWLEQVLKARSNRP